MIGKIFSQYEITAQIGEGGMGAVYRARDTRLDRDVAIKFISVDMSGDAERIARFQREAKTLASLLHPNIAAVYGFEDIDGVRFMVMELVEGEDLSARLKSGPLPEEEAVDIIRRVAAGMSEAHRVGIMHRDLKPANIMLTPDGHVKVLDFGLAKATGGDVEEGSDPAMSPTITAAMTQAGTIMGTAAYMAPEQARGKKVDHRADIWAMGAILFELLTGRRLFEGETVSDVLASVIKLEPDLDPLPRGTSPQVRRMLRRCLQRDPRKRLHSAADAVLELDEEDIEAGPRPAGRRPVLPWVVVAVLAAALAGVWFRPAPEPEGAAVRQYDVQLPDKSQSRSAYRPVVSPDGRWLAVTLGDSMRGSQLMLRSLETGQSTWVENSEGSEFPFWSPDSRFLGYFQGGRMRKLHLESGTSQVITTAVRSLFRGGAWSSDNRLLYAPGSNDGLFLIDAEGGQSVAVTELDTTMADGSHRWPQFLPDGRRFVFTQWSNVQDERSEYGGIFLGSLDGDAPRRLMRDVSAAVVSRSGHILFHRNGRLMATDFDLDAGTVSGEPFLVADQVAFQTPNGLVGASVSHRGDLFLSDHDPDTGLRLGWLDRAGQVVDTFPEEAYLSLAVELSADGDYYAAELLGGWGSVAIWIGDLGRGSMARLSHFDSDCWGPIFSPDGREVLYGVQGLSSGTLYRHEINGAGAPVPVIEFDDADNGSYAIPGHWYAPDKVLLANLDPVTRHDGIYLLDLQDNSLSPVLNSGFDQGSPRLSPDGRWLAYVADDSGTPEIYVRNWPELDRKWQVSREGGLRPHWRNDGAELVFASVNQREIRGVEFDGRGDAPQLSLPQRITPLGMDVLFASYAADHQRYLAGFSTADLDLPPVSVLTGWGQPRR